jgi:hypothetical protein
METMKKNLKASAACAAWLLALGLAGAPVQADVWTGQSSTACIPTPGDYDGDGNIDLSLLCLGAWHFYNDNGTYIKGIWTGFVAGDLPVPADYDGDGDTDVAIFRGGTWVFFDYATGLNTSNVWTGGASGIPLPLDYDGDGRAELSIYASGAWHFYNPATSRCPGTMTGTVSTMWSSTAAARGTSTTSRAGSTRAACGLEPPLPIWDGRCSRRRWISMGTEASNSRSTPAAPGISIATMARTCAASGPVAWLETGPSHASSSCSRGSGRWPGEAG